MKEHEQNMQEFNQKQLRKSEGTEDQEEGGSIEVYQNNVQYKANDMVTESSPDMSKTDGFIDDGDDIPSSSLADSPISPQKREMNDIVVHQQQINSHLQKMKEDMDSSPSASPQRGQWNDNNNVDYK